MTPSSSDHSGETRRLFDELRQAHQRIAAALDAAPGAFITESRKTVEIVERLRTLEKM
jgi:hypothetical protein